MKKYFTYLLFFTFPLFGNNNDVDVIRIGHFPNITHAQGVIGHHFTREKNGFFKKFLKSGVEIEWYIYQAGPPAMEAIFADSIDLAYVGPSPTVNAFIKSKGEALRIISGACNGGAALVIQADSEIKNNEDLKGKKIATPGFGNTQDIAARAFLKSVDINTSFTGGDAFVIPTNPANQLMLFKSKEIDGAFTIEPWVSLLVLEGKGKVFLEESSLWKETEGKYVTTHLVVSKKFLDKYPELVKEYLAAHVELTNWINTNKEEAINTFLKEFKEETKFDLKKEIITRAWNNVQFSNDPVPYSLKKMASQAFKIGFLKEEPNLDNIYDLTLLQEITTEK